MKKLFLSLAALCLTGSAIAQTTILPYASTWKYLDNGSNPGTAWRASSFTDAAWKSGKGQLGYGDGDETTVVSYGSSSSAKYITTYFRSSFTVSNPAVFANYQINTKRDDGIVVYINGSEVWRDNMPSGTIAYTTLSSTNCSDDGAGVETTTLSLSNSHIVSGSNSIAVEIHQTAASSSDISFDLQLLGLPAAPVVTLPRPDHIVVVMMENHSYNEIVGNASAPFINSLITGNNSANFTQSFGLTHPSQPNYLMLYSGSNQGVTDDGNPSFPFTTPNLGAQLIAKGFTFKGYSETMPSAGYTGSSSGKYARKHSPWVFWQGASSNAIPSASNQPFTAYPQNNFTTLPTVSFIIPNLDHDIHDGTVAQGDTWVNTNLSAYITWARTNNSLFILTFDEDDHSQNNQITTIFVGPMAKKGQYANTINHYNLLRTLEDMYGLPYAGNAASSSPIRNCWTTSPARLGEDNGENAVAEMELSPNPVNAELSIEANLTAADEIELSVISELGFKVDYVYKGTRTAGLQQFTYNASSLPAGIYYLMLKGEKNNKTVRFIKE
ncbi:MAG: T9SS type A sorting domain-containing protein [Cytophagaceae bacterium]|nr:T9SS type A sorting domain-containing protein [Cytophagaceae bacterium]